jgi:prepilin-type N-terminal cleavage/methylation domain-containing protein
LKRKGFTLIELMVVIAIIIILAAIAIPNYLKMTERAKRSRLASDFATLATVLETFKTDWGQYPLTAVLATGEAVSANTTFAHRELAGLQPTTVGINNDTEINAVGEAGPIEYIKTGTLLSMTNPFITANAVTYLNNANGVNWKVYAQIDTAKWLVRTDSSSQVAELAAVPTF